MIRFWILLLGILVLWSDLQAQSRKESREMKFHRKAVDYYNASAFDEALAEVQKALKINPEHVESWFLAGDIHNLRGDADKAMESYSRAINLDADFFPPAWYILANLQFNNRRYAEAIASYRNYLRNTNVKPAERRRAEKNTEIAEFRIHAMENPVAFEPVNLGPVVNTAGYEFVNYLSADGEYLYFTRRTPSGQRRDEDFYVSIRESDTSWRAATELGHPVNTPGDEGAMCLSPDGQLLFFAACNRPGGYGSCDIYMSRKSGDHWSEPENLGPAINTQYWESQPAFSPDGRTLYFVSNRPGGFGGSDIWISTLQPGGLWSEAVVAPERINTSEAERSPFVHPDGQTLYFSSKGHPGMGEGDIFFSRFDPDTGWSEPQNLGYPVNTGADEVTMVVDHQGKYAYISSAAEGGFGLQDIYRFRLPDHARPLPLTYMKGVVYDSISGKKLGADFVLNDLETGREVVRSRSNAATGEFLVCIPAGKAYALAVERSGYLFYSAHFMVEGEAGINRPFLRDVKMKPLILDEVSVLHNVFFETDSSRLLPESLTELERLSTFLMKNPGVSVEISGHTDNTGPPEHNRVLSERRAASVYDYLLKKGIPSRRLAYKGYGAERPLSGNDTPQGRALNRRTEFRISGLD